MPRRPASSWKFAFAVLAWTAQLLLAPAHAALMAASGEGGLAWCGPSDKALVADALSAKLAELPTEVRQALGASPDPMPSAECLLACASAPPCAAPYPVALDHRLDGITPVVQADGSQVVSIRLVHSPEVRGPPLVS